MTIDEIDLEILNMVQPNARVANAEMARRLGMAPSGVLERVRKLERKGTIQGYEARLCPQALGVSLLAFVFVRTDERIGDSPTAEALAQLPEVQEVHHVAGEDCYLVKVRTQDTDSLGRLLREKFGSIQGVLSTRTTIVLNTMKETGQLQLNHAEDEGAHPVD